MIDEGRRLVDAARTAGLTVRLLGGLAVREHCRTAELCERDYSDLDMVAPAGQAPLLAELFAGFGYEENYEVRRATGNAGLQFVRPCLHAASSGASVAHADDHVDVFLDTFRMDHNIALAQRLEIEPYTVSLSDLLLTKLQIFRLEDKDVRDIVTLLDYAEVAEEDTPGLVNSRYIGELCAADWGLFHDVATNLQRVNEGVAALNVSEARRTRVLQNIARLTAALEDAPKSLRWRLRARIGKRKSWHNEIDDQEDPLRMPSTADGP